MKMQSDTDVCTGHGVSEALGPDLFEVGGDGSVHRLTEDFSEADRQDLEDAVYSARPVAPGHD